MTASPPATPTFSEGTRPAPHLKAGFAHTGRHGRHLAPDRGDPCRAWGAPGSPRTVRGSGLCGCRLGGGGGGRCRGRERGTGAARRRPGVGVHAGRCRGRHRPKTTAAAGTTAPARTARTTGTTRTAGGSGGRRTGRAGTCRAAAIALRPGRGGWQRHAVLRQTGAVGGHRGVGARTRPGTRAGARARCGGGRRGGRARGLGAGPATAAAAGGERHQKNGDSQQTTAARPTGTPMPPADGGPLDGHGPPCRSSPDESDGSPDVSVATNPAAIGCAQAVPRLGTGSETRPGVMGDGRRSLLRRPGVACRERRSMSRPPAPRGRSTLRRRKVRWPWGPGRSVPLVGTAGQGEHLMCVRCW